jgi:hypothetical protein
MRESPVPIESIDILAGDDDAVALSCSLRLCKHTATRDVLAIPRAKRSCLKGMHLSCFTSKYKYADFPKLVQNVQIVCTKGCYKAVTSPMALTYYERGGALVPYK